MQNNGKLKQHLPLCSLPQAHGQFTPAPLPTRPPDVGLWSVHNRSFLLLLPPHTFALLRYGVVHGLQSFEEYPPASARGPSLTAVYLPVLPWSSPWAEVQIPALLWVFPWDHGMAGVGRDLKHHLVATPCHGEVQPAGKYLLHHGVLQGLQGNPCSGAWRASSPPSLPPWCVQGCFSPLGV